jgi:pyruvate formate lyase activating enzyme
LNSIRDIHALGFWLEVVTLVVPGFNDSDQELRQMAEFLVSVSPDIPWHVTAFHPDYRMTDPAPTAAAGLIHAAEIGQEAGLRYVYAGNLPGFVGEYEDTKCPGCGQTVIRRRGFALLSYEISETGACRACGAAIPGRWSTEPERIALAGVGDWHLRRPRAVV